MRLIAESARDSRAAPDPEAKVNLTDPESRVVRDYHGYFQGYNVQAAATRAATDVDELHPMLEAVNRNLQSVGWQPMRVLLADAGYYSDENVRSSGERDPELVIATRATCLWQPRLRPTPSPS